MTTAHHDTAPPPVVQEGAPERTTADAEDFPGLFCDLTLGPDDILVLATRDDRRIAPEYAATLAAQVPEALRGRVLVVDGFDIGAIRPAVGG